MKQDGKTKDLFDKLSEPAEPNWSTHQRAIFDWIDSGSGNAAVMAVAGAGKTTTLVEAINRTPEGQSVLAIAYNKTAGDALKKRVRAGIEANTFHSFCHRQIKRCFPKALLDHEGNSLEGLLRQQIRYGLRGDARKLIGLAKNIGVGVLQDNTSRMWLALIKDADLDLRLLDNIEQVFTEHIKTIDQWFSFDDMLYLPLIVKDMPLARFDWVFIDEAQDWNPTMIGLLPRLLTEGGRIVAFGDPCQSIYAFRGADAHAFQLIVDTFRCQTLPLTVSFRCARAVVRRAQKIVSYLH